MSKFINKAVQSSVRKPVSSDTLVLQVLEAQHAILLKLENDSPDGDISELNNTVRSLLDRAWSGSSLSLREVTSDD